MSGGLNLLVAVLIFIAGCASCYICMQFEYLEIDNKVNVAESALALSTIIVGLYLGITISSRFNNKNYLIHFIEPKLEECWKKCNNVGNIIEANTHIDVPTFTKNIKEVDIALAHLEKIFLTFEKNKQCIKAWQDSVDSLERFMMGAPIQNDIIDFTAIKLQLIKKLETVDERYVETVNFIHRK